jgi:hypothetical protein
MVDLTRACSSAEFPSGVGTLELHTELKVEVRLFIHLHLDWTLMGSG